LEFYKFIQKYSELVYNLIYLKANEMLYFR
jgi:hypothetical protein